MLVARVQGGSKAVCDRTPSGARFKGGTSFVVQELVVHPHVIEFQCERWLAADGKLMTVPLPEGFEGHFGPQLRRFVLALYHQGQTTVPRLLALLGGFGIDVSKRELAASWPPGMSAFTRKHAKCCAPGLRAGLYHGGRHRSAPPRTASAPRSASPISPPSSPFLEQVTKNDSPQKPQTRLGGRLLGSLWPGAVRYVQSESSKALSRPRRIVVCRPVFRAGCYPSAARPSAAARL